MNNNELKNLFQNKYNRENWIKLLQDIFPDSDFRKVPVKLSLPSDKAKEGFELGCFKTSDGSLIGIFEVCLDGRTQLEKNRVGLRNILRPFYKQIDGAFAVFYQGSKWRFSFISEIRVKDNNGNWVDNKTEPKRYTYVLGKDESVTTAIQRFQVLLESPKSIVNINDAFSVEKLSKEFFDKYIEHYKLFVNHLSQNEFNDTVFDNNEKLLRDFVKKLLGRIVFIYFLQKKGWMGVPFDSKKYINGDVNFVYNLFIKSGKDERFYSKWLKRLFFNTLNNPNRENESFKLPDKSIVKIPYLNGGLFEDDDPKGYIEFPPLLFSNLFEFFNQYNFTIYEDSPEEQTVAVDPEMLGHIFENLLEDNKDKGAFYTPKEIVHYMCQESLIEYLMVKLNIVEQKLASTKGKTEDLFGNKNSEQLALSSKEIKYNITRKDLELLIVKKEINKSIIEFADDINKHLDEVKICDPAIGSGAFPMGLLNEIFILKQIIQPHIHKSKKLSNAAIKENIIQNSIYGVDIEKGAVDIARLRFWLSLVVDEDQPRPLPNLDYKIVVGNSLLPMYDDKYLRIGYEYKGDDRNKAMLEVTEEQLREIENLENEFFKLKENKDSVRQHINNTKIDLIINLLSLQKKIDERKNLIALDIFGMSERDKKKNDDIRAILNDYDNKIKSLKDAKKYSRDFSYFDWHLDFSQVFNRKLPKHLRGFDIVIGNPPYIDSENMVKNQPELRNYITNKFISAKGNWDMYIPFHELALSLLKTNGIKAYITPNKWLSIGYGKELRLLSLEKLYKICNCSNIKVFDAGNSPVISFFRNSVIKDVVIDIISGNKNFSTISIVNKELFNESDFGILLSNNISIILKMRSSGSIVSDFIQCENPFSTNEAYNLISLIKDSNDSSTNDFKLINTGTIDPYISLWGVKNTTYLKSKYKRPVVSRLNFKKHFPKRFIQMSSKKIIISGMRYFECFLDYSGDYIAGKSTIILRNPKNDNSFYLLMGILNSNLIRYYINESFSTLGIDGGINFSKDMVGLLPIPLINKQNNIIVEQIINSVKKIIRDTSFNEEILENEIHINQLVYKLYDLTEQEISIIENN